MITLVRVEVKGNTRNDLLNALREIAKVDDDFNGNNGEEFLWLCVNRYRYTSNMEFLLNSIGDMNDDEFINYYFEQWLEDDEFWTYYKYDVIKNDVGEIKHIVLVLENE